MTTGVSPLKQVMDHYFTKFEKTMGFKCSWTKKEWPRFTENLKFVIKMYGAENTMKMIDFLFATDDEWIANKTDRSPGVLLEKRNFIAMQALRPKKDGGNLGVPL